MSEPVNYLTERLSDETLVHILHYVQHHHHFVRISETCRRLEEILRDREFCGGIGFPWYAQLSRNSVTRFLKDRTRGELVTRLDISDVYWIPSGIIRDLVVGMVNLETFLAAGTPLRWAHLAELLKSLPIKRLSWSWDNMLEESCRRRSSISPTKFSELMEMKEMFLKLEALLVHIPMMSKTPTDVLFYSYSALEYLVSLCKNLEELWFLSWPKTAAERKSSSSSHQRSDPNDVGLNLEKLRTLVISVKGPPRFSPMSFFGRLVTNFGVTTPPEVFWLDHPLLGIRSLFAGSSDQTRQGNRAMFNCVLPQLCSEKANRLSYPILSFIHAPKDTFNNPQLKHLLICHGQPIVVNLDGLFDNSPDLETFYCSTFNFKLDWNKFVERHPKLKAISMSETKGMEDSCNCLAFSKLDKLEHLSIPIDCLYEIRDPKMLSEYTTLRYSKEDNTPENQRNEATLGSSGRHTSNSSSIFKKRRIGLPSKPTATVTNSIAGLNFVALGCSKLRELEIGYGDSNQAKAGRFCGDALFCISKFRVLQNLSLTSLPIHSGKFLVEILKNCDITNLRLTHLGPAAKCCYIQDLCQALPYGRVLKDFRLEQNYIGTPLLILNALKKCKNIQRVLIWSSPNDKPLELDPVDNFFKTCPKLTMFYATIEGTTKADCFRIRKALEAKYKTERPALSIVIRRTLEEEELIHYPSIHYRQMVVNNTQVCQFNDFSSFNVNDD